MARSIAALCLAALLGSLTGAWHPAGDSLAVFRPVWALGLLAAALILRARAGLAAAVLAIAALAPILWNMRPVAGPETGIAVYQKNLRYDLADPAPIIGDIRVSGAGIVFLQEVSERNLTVPQALRASHPHQLICPAHTVGAVAILSRWPLQAQDCMQNRGMAVARAETPVGALSLAVLHLEWPWPHDQAGQLDALLQKIGAIVPPAVIAGDFNMVPWSHAVRRVAEATGTRRVGPLRATFALAGLYPMPIDHVLMPQGWRGRAETRGRLGSDHRGVLARMGSR